MECFVIFVMAWCWFNATESKPQNVVTNIQKNLMNKILCLIFICFLTSCEFKKQDGNNNAYTIDEKLEKWTDSIRKMVIKEVRNYAIDSIKIDSNDYYIENFHYHNGSIVKAFGLTKDKKDTISYYYKSLETKYIANGENCPINNENLINIGGLHNYSGLKYNDKHIGIAIYSECDNSTFEKGLYFNGQRIGKWIKKDSEKKSFVVNHYESIEKLQKFANLKN